MCTLLPLTLPEPRHSTRVPPDCGATRLEAKQDHWAGPEAEGLAGHVWEQVFPALDTSLAFVSFLNFLCSHPHSLKRQMSGCRERATRKAAELNSGAHSHQSVLAAGCEDRWRKGGE